jgi:uncharacterized membrane protein YfcA
MNDILIFAGITFLAILIQSFVGFAGALTAVPLFTIFLSAKEAIPTYSMVVLLIDVWLVYEARRHLEWRGLSKLLAGGIIGIPIGAFALRGLPSSVLSVFISVMTCSFALLLLMRIRFNLNQTTGTQVGVGLLSGILGGSISESGPPVFMYGLARNWSKDMFRTTLLGYFVCIYAMAVVSYWHVGLITQKNLIVFSIAIVPAFLASGLGIVLKNKASEAFFRQAILFIVIAVSLVNLSKTLWVH